MGSTGSVGSTVNSSSLGLGGGDDVLGVGYSVPVGVLVDVTGGLGDLGQKIRVKVVGTMVGKIGLKLLR